MSKKQFYFILLIILSSNMASSLFLQSIIINRENTHSLNASTTSIPSEYQIKNSVTYMVEINFSLNQTSGSGNYNFKLPRLNHRGPNSTLSPLCPPYQESELVYYDLYGNNPSQTLLNHTDRFNNTYDSFNASLGPTNQEVKLSSKYIINLKEITFENILPSDIGIYNTSDNIFELYCNKSETFYNRSDPNLIALSNNIVNPTDNPIIKANKIINWISDNIEYNDSLEVEIGASSAYGNLTGDCSEFSSLMITLLRIQGIPARKITGFCISNSHNFKPEKGEVYTFYSTKSATNLLGHAWVEYYIPDIGWIACDPTWHQATNTYFNRIDYLRFNYNVGSWFFFPPDELHSEFPIPYATGSYIGTYNYEFQFKVTVLDTNYLSIDPMILIVIAIVVIIVVISIITIISVRKKRNKWNF